MKILHLFHDLMNLYGDNGNVKILIHCLQQQVPEVILHTKSVNCAIDFPEYDIIYIGSGTEQSQKAALFELRRHRLPITSAIEQGTVFLTTGNAFEMLGKAITAPDGTVFEGLGVFDFYTVEQNKQRFASDMLCETPFCSAPVIGFTNKCSQIYAVEKHLFTVKYGIGDNLETPLEGIWHNNFFGTHMVGPILARNPEFLRQFANLAISQLDNTIETEKYVPNPYAQKAYELSLNRIVSSLRSH